MKFVDSENNLLLDWNHRKSHRKVGMRVIDYTSRMSRSWLRKTESYDNILVKTGTRVASIDQTDTGVNLLAHPVSTDTPENYVAQYVIGCDGANSQTRTIIQSELDDWV